MSDQAKRWTAIDRGIYHGKDLVACGNKVWGNLSDDRTVATRLAACADLLRGVGDLSAVAVMRWADVEKVRRGLEYAAEQFTDDGMHREATRCLRALEAMPVPPKGDA